MRYQQPSSDKPVWCGTTDKELYSDRPSTRDVGAGITSTQVRCVDLTSRAAARATATESRSPASVSYSKFTSQDDLASDAAIQHPHSERAEQLRGMPPMKESRSGLPQGTPNNLTAHGKNEIVGNLHNDKQMTTGRQLNGLEATRTRLRGPGPEAKSATNALTLAAARDADGKKTGKNTGAPG